MWVAGLVTTPAHQPLAWIMVQHISRGWELPGGKINSDEVPNQAILREVKEECGLKADFQSMRIKIGDKGHIAHLHAPLTKTITSWKSDDPHISEVRVFHQIPSYSLAWGSHELEFVLRTYIGDRIARSE